MPYIYNIRTRPSLRLSRHRSRLLRLDMHISNRVFSLMQTPEQYQDEYDSRRGSEYSRFHGYTYDGIWTVALAVKHVARRIRHFHRNQTISDFRYRDVLWEQLFLDALRNTSFDGVTVSWPRLVAVSRPAIPNTAAGLGNAV